VRFSRAQGQDRAGRILEGLLETGRMPNALLFHGLEGTGKTMVAHDFAKTLLCASMSDAKTPCGICPDCDAIDRRLHPDVKAVNPAYQASLLEEDIAKQRSLKVETIRHLRRDMEMQSLLGRWKVAVIEDAHSMVVEAANALLKILEEPPPRTLWILVTPQRERMIKTVLSRCFSVPFSPLPEKALAAILAGRGIEPRRAAELARLAEGSASRALELDAAGESPAEFLADPMKPVAAAEGLPRDLASARAEAERTLYALGQELRLRHLDGTLEYARAEKALASLSRLRAALRSNADPRVILTLAGVEAQNSIS